ncbi:MAG: hypothetical protein PG981_000965 [Wolbachia endosymbiont of Ctenocephalides orientis wCori]|nr:MAG: hypothetical protein PG981_000965 [Wolbachia endosymbiont of Ctenocephalides orientis wCori]
MSTAEYSNVFEERNQVSTTKLPPATELCTRSTAEYTIPPLLYIIIDILY